MNNINDEELYVLAQVEDERTFNLIEDKYKNNLSFVIEFCKKIEEIPQYLPNEIRNNKKFWTEMLKEEYFEIFAMPDELKKDKLLMRKVIVKGYYNLDYIDISLKNDESFISEIVRDLNYIDGTIFLAKMGEELKNNKRFIIEQLKNPNLSHHSNIFNKLSEELKNDKELLFELKDVINNFSIYKEQKELLEKYEREDVLNKSFEKINKSNTIKDNKRKF